MDNKTKQQRNYFMILQENVIQGDTMKNILINERFSTDIFTSFIFLIDYAKNKNGLVCKIIDNKKEPLTFKEMQALLYFLPNKNRLENILKILIKNGLIEKIKNGKSYIYKIKNYENFIGSQTLGAEEKRKQRARAKSQELTMAQATEEEKAEILKELEKPTAYEQEQEHLKQTYGEPIGKPKIKLDASLQEIFTKIKK